MVTVKIDIYFWIWCSIITSSIDAMFTVRSLLHMHRDTVMHMYKRTKFGWRPATKCVQSEIYGSSASQMRELLKNPYFSPAKFNAIMARTSIDREAARGYCEGCCAFNGLFDYIVEQAACHTAVAENKELAVGIEKRYAWVMKSLLRQGWVINFNSCWSPLLLHKAVQSNMPYVANQLLAADTTHKPGSSYSMELRNRVDAEDKVAYTYVPTLEFARIMLGRKDVPFGANESLRNEAFALN